MSTDSSDVETTLPSRPENGKTIGLVFDYSKTVLATLLIAFLLKTFVVEAFRIPSGSMENTLQVGDFLIVNKLAYGLRTPRYLPLTNYSIPSAVLPVFTEVRRGDVLVFEFPGVSNVEETGDQLNYIKRCIGLPGDTVMIRQSRVFVNGRELSIPPEAKLGDNDGMYSWHRGVRLVPGGKGYTENDYGPIVVPRRGDVIPLDRRALEDWRSFILREGHRLEQGPDGVALLDGQPAETYTIEDNYYFVLGDNRHNSLDSRFWGFVPDRHLIGEALMVYWSWNPDIGVMDVGEKTKSIRWGRIGMMIR